VYLKTKYLVPAAVIMCSAASDSHIFFHMCHELVAGPITRLLTKREEYMGKMLADLHIPYVYLCLLKITLCGFVYPKEAIVTFPLEFNRKEYFCSSWDPFNMQQFSVKK